MLKRFSDKVFIGITLKSNPVSGNPLKDFHEQLMSGTFADTSAAVPMRNASFSSIAQCAIVLNFSSSIPTKIFPAKYLANCHYLCEDVDAVNI